MAFQALFRRPIMSSASIAHAYTFTPAMSAFADCDSAGMLDSAVAHLAEGGQILMPIADYRFTRRFGWCSDRVGVSRQLNRL